MRGEPSAVQRGEGGASVHERHETHGGLYRRYTKRVIDVVVSATALALLAPIIVLTAAAVRVALGSPVLFRQQRPGRGGVPFELRKFRTMRDAHAPDGRALPDDERLTRFGRWLRRTSLDELPQLWNVLLGDMSLIGPRPLLMQYLPLYTPEQMRRHDVRPGITGHAQVNGRNALTWERKFELDVWYVDHCSLQLDLRILFQTIARVASASGVSEPGHVTASYFTGNSPRD